MDHIAHFERETTAFHRAALMAALPDDVPPVPSCPEWTAVDLVRHLGHVHRLVNHLIVERLQSPPQDGNDLFQAPEDLTRDDLPDWFAEGAIALAATFRMTAPEVPVWTWAKPHDVGFWLRVQTIEAGLHRWDLEGAIGSPQPVDKELAADGLAEFVDTVVPFRRVLLNPPPMAGESYRLRQTDGPGTWSVALDPDGPRPLADDEPAGVELAGTASDLLLYLWHRIPGEPLLESGDAELLERLFVLVPTV